MNLKFNHQIKPRHNLHLIPFTLVLLAVLACLFPAGCIRSRKASGQGSSSTAKKGSAEKKTSEPSKETDHKALQKDTGQGKYPEKDEDSQDVYKKSNPQSNTSSDQNRDSSDSSSDGSSDGGYRNRTVTKSGKIYISRKISFDSSWKYGEFSKIHSGTAVLYTQVEGGSNGSNNSYGTRDTASIYNRKNVTVCINAGHGTKGGSSVKTLCHPDGSPKIISGSTSQGQTEGPAITEGMTFPDGTSEAAANLSLARLVRDRLLEEGYDVLMIRDDEDVQLDNIARALMANRYADCHIALHYDSTDSDKGVFFLSVPDSGGYRNMEPVRSHWREHQALGSALISGIKANGLNLYQGGSMDMDLTQTSYSTIPSIDLEVGDAGSDISKGTQEKIADGIVRGLDRYYSK